jgi:hypothetical protein
LGCKMLNHNCSADIGQGQLWRKLRGGLERRGQV